MSYHHRPKHMTGPYVCAMGGGINSMGVLIGMRDLGITPDLILMSDTGGEKPETYAYINVVNDWCRRNRFPFVKTVRNDGIYVTLEENCLQKAMLPSLAYGFKTCSDKYKVRPSDKYLRFWMAQRPWLKRVTKVIGYDAGEPHRVKDYADDKYDFWYPLIEWGWRREECVQAITRERLPLPPKSSCFFCPASKKSEVIWLKDTHPDLFARAVAMERGAELQSIKGLGRSWSWDALGRADDQQARLFADPPEMPCMCTDGDSADDD